MRETDLDRCDLNLLRILLALLETRGVSAAAQRVGLSQPAVSRALGRLRRDFGDPLLVRTGGGMAATPRAVALLDPLRALLAKTAALYRAEAFDPASARQVFRGAMPDVIAATILPRFAALLLDEAPSCRIEIVPWAFGAMPGAAAEIDFAISCEPHLYPSMRMEPLFEDDDRLAVRADRAAAIAAMGLAEIAALPHVAVATAAMPHDPVDRWWRAVGVERNIAVAVPHYLQALHLVASSNLVAVLPSRFCAGPGAALGVAALDLPLAPSPDRQWLFTPVTAEADPASIWLRALVRRAAAAV
ncbi:LysR family transcriptional regulator [Sphingopyxis sp. LK2115]|jgi:DNA-binding transcriptional LysR family regulator|uniref:LysR family transcriptional regulator n=1 Tax=Sphingopyxis sp. LK2115 TaxID=2744558 RepID=UPI0016608E58|nr:LysR family transcriptional regulator [Sphingopyxis sp. LK2115]